MSKKKSWRLSDQTNADLPVGKTYIDDCGRITRLTVDWSWDYGRTRKVWVAYPEGCPAFYITGDGPGSIVKAWDKKVSYERNKSNR